MNSSVFKFTTSILLILFSNGKAKELPPGKMLLPESALPEYEAKIDHARLIKDRSRNVFKLGESVYELNCQSCHGRPGFEGSVPNSLKFWEGKFQHGSDPYTMYNTLTRGWRLMVPQVMLTPREKYAVIHYIREQFINKKNPNSTLMSIRNTLMNYQKEKN
jgi:cytochrome c5